MNTAIDTGTIPPPLHHSCLSDGTALVVADDDEASCPSSTDAMISVLLPSASILQGGNSSNLVGANVGSSPSLMTAMLSDVGPPVVAATISSSSVAPEIIATGANTAFAVGESVVAPALGSSVGSSKIIVA